MGNKKRDGIRQRGDSYLVDVTVHGKRRTATCKTYEEARVKRLQMEAEMLEDTQPQAATTCWTLGQALKVSTEVRWLNTRNGTKAIACAKEVVDHFGSERSMDTITTVDVDGLVRRLRLNGNKAGTINRKLAALSALFTDAVEREGCSKRPKIIRQAEPTHRVRYLTPEEESLALSLLQQWGQAVVRDAFVVLVDTGMRVGELLALAPRDIDTRENIISIWQNKGDLPRSVPMTARVQEVVMRRLEAARVFDDLHRETLRYWWDRLRSAMDMDDDAQFVPHALRHTCATRLVQAGVSLYVVQKILGHSNIQVTSRYSHLSERELRGAIDVLQEAVTKRLPQGRVHPLPATCCEPPQHVADEAASKLRATV